MNVVCTGTGDFVEIQGTAEREPFSRAMLGSLLDLAHGRLRRADPAADRGPERGASVADPARRVVLATRNAGKIAELNRILADVGGGVEIVGLESFPDAPDVPETGLTFADNALLKARAIAAYTGLPAVSDDSGLAADALHGMPGRAVGPLGGQATATTTPTWSCCSASSRTSTERGAAFVCVAALALPGGREWTATGVLAGTLTRARRGGNGFGYDPIFVPEGLSTTTAELAPADKDAISHRGRAFRAIAPLIAAHA